MTIGLIVNQTAVVDGVHLIDLVAGSTAVELGAVFAPEHGLRGLADAGELAVDGVDERTGVPVHSLYGANRQPTLDQLRNLDALVYDIQDVGCRFYTYIATMGLAMQRAAETGIPFVVLDRPEPQGGTRPQGPIGAVDVGSFVSPYPIPSAYAMTAGELAQAIKGEAWLPGLQSLDLRVIRVDGWRRGRIGQTTESDWVPPSPALPSLQSARAYPGTVLLEATTLSYGSGGPWPFSSVGAPWLDADTLAAALNGRSLPGVRFESVTMTADPAIAPRARFPNQQVPAVRIAITEPAAYEAVSTGVHLLAEAFAQADAGGHRVIDRPATFDLLAGSTSIRAGLEAGLPTADIVAGWQVELAAFEQIRGRYLLYP
ncbi:MAG: DUF1343 domain-containing protein [Actinomycetota bacterium]|nr:DUF1343 domain-containing protein [Actinomycetota bacterium]